MAYACLLLKELLWSVGRACLTALGVTGKHDLYSASAGIYILWGAYLAGVQVRKLIGKQQICCLANNREGFTLAGHLPSVSFSQL